MDYTDFSPFHNMDTLKIEQPLTSLSCSNLQITAQENATSQKQEIPLYLKAFRIPHIQPNCLEVVHDKKVTFACKNGFFIGTFYSEDDMELL